MTSSLGPSLKSLLYLNKCVLNVNVGVRPIRNVPFRSARNVVLRNLPIAKSTVNKLKTRWTFKVHFDMLVTLKLLWNFCLSGSLIKLQINEEIKCK